MVHMLVFIRVEVIICRRVLNLFDAYRWGFLYQSNIRREDAISIADSESKELGDLDCQRSSGLRWKCHHLLKRMNLATSSTFVEVRYQHDPQSNIEQIVVWRSWLFKNRACLD